MQQKETRYGDIKPHCANAHFHGLNCFLSEEDFVDQTSRQRSLLTSPPSFPLVIVEKGNQSFVPLQDLIINQRRLLQKPLAISVHRSSVNWLIIDKATCHLPVCCLSIFFKLWLVDRFEFVSEITYYNLFINTLTSKLWKLTNFDICEFPNFIFARACV